MQVKTLLALLAVGLIVIGIVLLDVDVAIAMPELPPPDGYFSSGGTPTISSNTDDSQSVQEPTITATTKPGKPTALATHSVTHNSLTFTWTAPTGGPAISDYNIQYKVSGGSWTSYDDGKSNLPTTDVAGLSAFTSYEFRVRAVSGSVSGYYSEPEPIKTLPAPCVGNTLDVPGTISTRDGTTIRAKPGYAMHAIGVCGNLEVRSATTDSNGIYNIRGIKIPESGHYVIQTNYYPAGHTLKSGNWYEWRMNDQQNRTNTTPFNVTFDKVQRSEFVTINIKAYVDRNQNHRYDAGERPFGLGFTPHIIAYKTGVWHNNSTTNSSGSVLVNTIPPDDFAVSPPRLIAAGDAFYTVQDIRLVTNNQPQNCNKNEGALINCPDLMRPGAVHSPTSGSVWIANVGLVPHTTNVKDCKELDGPVCPGTPESDYIIGKPNKMDHITGGGGNDVIYGNNGTSTGQPHGNTKVDFDILDGEGGHDTIYGGYYKDVIIGGDGRDTIYGYRGNDDIRGGGGIDTIYGGPGDDTIHGGADDDILYGYADNYAHGGPGDDDGNDSIEGGLGEDEIYGGKGHDCLYGGVKKNDNDPVTILFSVPCNEGDDTKSDIGDEIFGGSGHDIIFGGPGEDEIHGDDPDLLPSLHMLDIISGGPGEDEIRGGGSAYVGSTQPGLARQVIYGNGEDDTIYGGNNDDEISGGPGQDTIHGALGDDIIRGAEPNNNTGDRVDYIYGGPGDDIIYGGPGGDQLHGGASKDHIYGDAGKDRIWGNEGHDVLHGGSGTDTMWGGGENDDMWGGGGIDYMYGGPGEDVMRGNGENDKMWGGPDDDAMAGNDGNDEMHGEAGADEMCGGAGADELYGGSTPPGEADILSAYLSRYLNPYMQIYFGSNSDDSVDTLKCANSPSGDPNDIAQYNKRKLFGQEKPRDTVENCANTYDEASPSREKEISYKFPWLFHDSLALKYCKDGYEPPSGR